MVFWVLFFSGQYWDPGNGLITPSHGPWPLSIWQRNNWQVWAWCQSETWDDHACRVCLRREENNWRNNIEAMWEYKAMISWTWCYFNPWKRNIVTLYKSCCCPQSRWNLIPNGRLPRIARMGNANVVPIFVPRFWWNRRCDFPSQHSEGCRALLPQIKEYYCNLQPNGQLRSKFNQ